MQATYKNKMKTYCVKCKNNTQKKVYPKIFRTKNNRLIMQSKCPVCRIKNQEAKGLLSNLANRTPLSKIPLLNILF